MKLKEIDLYITEKCNLSCPFCSICAGNNNSNILDLCTIKDIVNQSIDLDLEEIHITGGEPTIHPDFLEIMKFVLSKEIGVRLITNGTTLNQPLLERLYTLGLRNIMISIDGVQEFHDSVRGMGSYDVTFKNIIKAKELGYTVRVNSVAWKENEESICKLIPILERLDIEIYSIFLGSPVGRANNHKQLSSFGPYEWRSFVTKVNSSLSNNPKMQLVIEKAFVFEDEHETNDFNLLRGCDGIESRHDYISIRASGDIYPCVFFSNNKEFSFGNVKENKIADILNNSESCIIYKKITKTPTECHNCKNKLKCYGGCKGYSNFLDNVVNKDPRCHSVGKFYPVCPLIKMDLSSQKYAACTDDLVEYE